MPNPHSPVLYQEVITALEPKSGGRYVDGTLGAGGHAAGILQASAPEGLLLGLDVDPQAIRLAQEHLARFGVRAIIIQASYLTILEQIKTQNWSSVDGILLDLGVSSMQLENSDRGFSFQIDAPLDMRFDPSNPIYAGLLVNQLSEQELADLIFRLGEEPAARQIAHAIVSARPIETTKQLAEAILQAIGHRRDIPRYNHSLRKKKSEREKLRSSRRSIHPATRTFQALRMAVNNELEAIAKVLPQAIQALTTGGRLAVISFHSLEDRIVKQYFRKESQDCICPPRQPVCTCGHKAIIRELNRQPIRPTALEIEKNPRSRSAKLRVIEKLLVG